MNNRLKRKLVQWATLGLTNAQWPNFLTGSIYKGPLKQVCVPGLNCYSCPGAIGSCPIGALQSVMGSEKFSFSFYVVGLLLLMGVALGRFICGFLCPFGLIQELINKIPFPKIRPWKGFRYVKYAVLGVFVIALPLLLTNYMGMGKPAFCQYICPAGTLEGGIPLLLTHQELRNTIGNLFALKVSILVLTVLGCLSVYRFFCKVLCPLGAIYALMNRVSFYRLHIDRAACVGCGACAKVCKMQVDPVAHPNHAECIRCGDCATACPKSAIRLGFAVSARGKRAGRGEACAQCGGCKER